MLVSDEGWMLCASSPNKLPRGTWLFIQSSLFRQPVITPSEIFCDCAAAFRLIACNLMQVPCVPEWPLKRRFSEVLCWQVMLLTITQQCRRDSLVGYDAASVVKRRSLYRVRLVPNAFQHKLCCQGLHLTGAHSRLTSLVWTGLQSVGLQLKPSNTTRTRILYLPWTPQKVQV